MTNIPVLRTTHADISAAVSRSLAGAIPFVGTMVGEIVNVVIPGQRLDRVVAFLEVLSDETRGLRERQALLEERLSTAEGSDLLEEGLKQAARAISSERRGRIGRILIDGVTGAEIQYDRTKTLLSILGALTDSELILLVYYSETLTSGSEHHRRLREQYPDLLRPISREMRAPQAEVERGAFRDSYERSLIAHGLLQHTDQGLRITPLGKLLLRSSSITPAAIEAPAP